MFAPHDNNELKSASISEEEALEAIRKILTWIGEDPLREGLKDTPARVLKSYAEHFAGYHQDPAQILGVSFTEVANYQGIVTLKNIRFESLCEHHMSPIIGLVHIAYIPNGKIVGISKLARIVGVYAKRLQIQERMTAQIADAIYTYLNAKGVAVIIEAEHHCMMTRGVKNSSAMMYTQSFLGCMQPDDALTQTFLNSLHKNS